MMVRVCTKCKQGKPANLESFPPHKAGKYGLNSTCRPCKKAIDAERRNRPDQLARQKKWRDENKDKIKAANIAYRAGGYTSTADVARWRENNLERAREIDRNKVARWRKDHPWYVLKSRISARLSVTLKSGKMGKTTQDILGYTYEELCEHIESLFTEGMTWEKLMCGEIELDHIIPLAHFKADCIESDDFKKCWSLDNLQPLWKIDNRKKGARLDYEI